MLEHIHFNKRKKLYFSILLILICLTALLFGYFRHLQDLKNDIDLEKEFYSKQLSKNTFEQECLPPTHDVITDGETAVKITIAILEPIYGKEQIAREKPFKTILKNGVWTVEGTLSSNKIGGVAVVQINKEDGRILKVSHGK